MISEAGWTYVERIGFFFEVREEAADFSGKRVIVLYCSRDAGVQFRQIFVVTLPVDFHALI